MNWLCQLLHSLVTLHHNVGARLSDACAKPRVVLACYWLHLFRYILETTSGCFTRKRIISGCDISADSAGALESIAANISPESPPSRFALLFQEIATRHRLGSVTWPEEAELRDPTGPTQATRSASSNLCFWESRLWGSRVLCFVLSRDSSMNSKRAPLEVWVSIFRHSLASADFFWGAAVGRVRRFDGNSNRLERTVSSS